MAYTVLLPNDIAEEGRTYLAERGYNIKRMSGETPEAIIKDIADCDGIMARTALYPKEVIAAGKKLKVIGKHGVGCDNIDVEFATEQGIYVTFGPESNANSVAEHAVALMLFASRNMLEAVKAAHAGDWKFRFQFPGAELSGKTLGLIGAGRIGGLFAKKALYGFDMNVLVYDPYVKELKGVPEAKMVADMDIIFKEADFVSIHIPLTADTTGLVDKRRLGLMKKDAWFINVARGPLANQKDLYDVLKEKRIAGAAVDVFETEPPSPKDPLFSLDNVITTPHIAASTKEASIRMAVHAAMGIDEVLSGHAPKWPFNKPVKK